VNIGKINAVVVNAVEGVAYIGDQVVSIKPTDVRRAVRELDGALPGLSLPERSRVEQPMRARSRPVRVG
jgi:hypothetical protein